MAVAVLVAATAWFATRSPDSHTEHPAGAAPVVTVTRSYSPAPPPSVAAPGTPLGAVNCLVGAPVETEIVQALHRYFDGVRVDTLHANRCVRHEIDGPRIVYEAVRASIGRYDLVMALTARGPAGTGLPAVTGLGPRPEHPMLRGSLAVETAAVRVSIEVFGSNSGRLPVRRIHDLADYVSFSIVL